MERISQITPKIFCATTKSETRNWEKIIEKVKRHMTASGIDMNDPAKLPEIMAKVITRETNLGKGLMLYGTVGSGKSTRVRFLSNQLGIKMVNARELGAYWVDCGGNEVRFQEFCCCVNPQWDDSPEQFCDLIIDDMGTEEERYCSFGNSADVMRDIVIPWRYSKFPRWKTHITHNMTEAQLKKRYGLRVWSRLNEMCAFVSMTAPDRRLNRV